MDLKKLAPWNWFKKEEEEGTKVPGAHDSNRSSLQHPMLELQHEMDRVFHAFFRDWPLRSFPSLLENSMPGELGLFKPMLDLSATEKAYTATVEIPGVDPKDVKVELRKNNLFITGEKKQEQEHKGRDHYKLERSYGMFRRVLTLPEDANGEGISASYKNGIMTLTIPRKALPTSEHRQIEVKCG